MNAGRLDFAHLFAPNTLAEEGASHQVRHPLDHVAAVYYGSLNVPLATVSMRAPRFTRMEQAIVAVIRKKKKPKGSNYFKTVPKAQQCINLAWLTEMCKLSEKQWPCVPDDKFMRTCTSDMVLSDSSDTRDPMLQQYQPAFYSGGSAHFVIAKRHPFWFVRCDKYYVQFMLDQDSMSQNTDLSDWLGLLENQRKRLTDLEFAYQYFSRESSLRQAAKGVSCGLRSSNDAALYMSNLSPESDALCWSYLYQAMSEIVGASDFVNGLWVELVSFYSACVCLSPSGVPGSWLNNGLPNMDDLYETPAARPARLRVYQAGKSKAEVLDQRDDVMDKPLCKMVGPLTAAVRASYAISKSGSQRLRTVIDRWNHWNVLSAPELNALAVIYSRGRITPPELLFCGYEILMFETMNIIRKLRNDGRVLAQAQGVARGIVQMIMPFICPCVLATPDMISGKANMPDRCPVSTRRENPLLADVCPSGIFRQKPVNPRWKGESKVSESPESQRDNADFDYRAWWKRFIRSVVAEGSQSETTAIQTEFKEEIERDIVREAERIPGLYQRYVAVNEYPSILSNENRNRVERALHRLHIFRGSMDDSVDYYPTIQGLPHLDSLFDGDESLFGFTHIYTKPGQSINLLLDSMCRAWNGRRQEKVLDRDMLLKQLPGMQKLIQWESEVFGNGRRTASPVCARWMFENRADCLLFKIGDMERMEKHLIWGRWVHVAKHGQMMRLVWKQSLGDTHPSMSIRHGESHIRFPLSVSHETDIHGVTTYRKAVFERRRKVVLNLKAVPRRDASHKPLTVERKEPETRAAGGKSSIVRGVFCGFHLNDSEKAAICAERARWYDSSEKGRRLRETVEQRLHICFDRPKLFPQLKRSILNIRGSFLDTHPRREYKHMFRAVSRLRQSRVKKVTGCKPVMKGAKKTSDRPPARGLRLIDSSDEEEMDEQSPAARLQQELQRLTSSIPEALREGRFEAVQMEIKKVSEMISAEHERSKQNKPQVNELDQSESIEDSGESWERRTETSDPIEEMEPGMDLESEIEEVSSRMNEESTDPNEEIDASDDESTNEYDSSKVKPRKRHRWADTQDESTSVRNTGSLREWVAEQRLGGSLTSAVNERNKKRSLSKAQSSDEVAGRCQTSRKRNRRETWDVLEAQMTQAPGSGEDSDENADEECAEPSDEDEESEEATKVPARRHSARIAERDAKRKADAEAMQRKEEREWKDKQAKFFKRKRKGKTAEEARKTARRRQAGRKGKKGK